MLLRFAVLTSAFSAVMFGLEPAATPLFPDQDKSLAQLTRQALDKRLSSAFGGKPAGNIPNPTTLGRLAFAPRWAARAFPAINGDKTFCAIPLAEAKVQDGQAVDPIAKPAGKGDFDRLGKATPVPACQNWQ